MLPKLLNCAFAALLLGASSPALATSCAGSLTGNLCRLTGSTVVYEYDILDNSGALALLGTPELLGDTLRFLPPDLRVQSTNGAGTPAGGLAAAFTFSSVRSLDGSALAGISWAEFLDYRIDNGGQVFAGLDLEASSNSVATDLITGAGSIAAMAPLGVKTTDTLEVALDPSAAFAGLANDIRLRIQTSLQATTAAPGEGAWIQKKLALTAVTVVPAPPAVWLLGSAALSLAGFHLRRRGK